MKRAGERFRPTDSTKKQSENPEFVVSAGKVRKAGTNSRKRRYNRVEKRKKAFLKIVLK